MLRLLLAGLILWLAGCAHQPAPDSATPLGIDSLTPELKQRYNLALALLGAEKYDAGAEALAALDQAAPSIPEIQFNLALSEYGAGRHQAATATLAPLLAADEPRAHNLAGLLAELNGQLPAARAHFERALASRPTYPEANYNLARLLDIYWQDPAAAIPYYRAYLAERQTDEETRDWLEYLETSTATD